MKSLKALVVVFIIISTGIQMNAGNKNYTKLEIKSGWQFKKLNENQWLPATVPGCVHTDLITNKIIEDPYFGTNESKIQWIGETDWEYETSFKASDDLLGMNHIDLIFKGLDTYADVFLNDVKILSADNMFREWKVDCKDILKSTNTIRIKFRNVFTENLPKYNNAPYRLQAYDNNDQAEVKINMYSRKAGYHFGWDWGPRLITYGIWRPIYIEAWNDIKLNDVFVIQKNVSAVKADINSKLEILSDSQKDVLVKLLVNNSEITSNIFKLSKGMNEKEFSFEMKNPKLWWTNGLGEQHLYDFKYQVISDGNIIDERDLKVGIRSIELVREKDSIGTSFYFRVNGIPVFAKGANYIPQDNFQNRVTKERYDWMIKSAAEANMNILRIWGGGIYEEDYFYDLCDKYGILVWQEFMFACGMYPVDQPFLDNVKQEVIDNVRRLHNHTSLAMYCGNNENEISWFQWGWKQKYPEDIQKQYEKDYSKLFHDLIPNTLKTVDDTRYYHPSSPSSSFGQFSYNDGDLHYWSVWHGKEPFEKFNDNVARFVSEYGFQSYPEMNTIKKFTNPEDRHLHSVVILSHQRCMTDERRDKEYGNRLIQWYMERQYKQPKDFENYIYVAQLLQAEGVKMAIETHRRNMPKCMGTMYWQINDCWPVASWSSMDYYGKWKALHYFAKKAYEPVHITPRIESSEVKIYVTSDFRENVNLELSVCLYDFSGNQLFSKIERIEIKSNSNGIYFSIPKSDLLKNYDEKKVVLLAELRSEDRLMSQNHFYFVQPKELDLEKPEIKINPVKEADGYKIELTTNKLAKNVYLRLDETEGFFSDNFFDLIPGETKVLQFKTEKNNIDQLSNKLKVISLMDSY